MTKLAAMVRAPIRHAETRPTQIDHRGTDQVVAFETQKGVRPPDIAGASLK